MRLPLLGLAAAALACSRPRRPGATSVSATRSPPRRSAARGPETGPRGNLRDSDDAASVYGYELFNWAVHFDEPIHQGSRGATRRASRSAPTDRSGSLVKSDGADAATVSLQ